VQLVKVFNNFPATPTGWDSPSGYTITAWPDHLQKWSIKHSKTAWGGKGCGGMEVEGERELIIIEWSIFI